MRRSLAIVVPIVALAACTAAPDIEPGFYSGVGYHLYEFDGTTRHEIGPDRRTKVDAHSDLVLEFQVERSGQADPASNEWLELNGLLELVNELAADYAEVNGVRVDPSDPAAVTDLQARANKNGAQRTGLLRRLVAAVGNKAATEIFTGQFGSNPGPADPYGNLARYLSGEIERLSDAVRDFTESRRRLAVAVEAFVQPKNGEPRQLHVDNFDSIPDGRYEPIDRFGLRLTNAEQKDLNMQIAQASQAATTVREIMASKGKLDEAVKELVARLKAQVDQFVSRLEVGTAGTWQQTIANAEQALRTRAADPAFAAVRAELTGLADHLQQLLLDVRTVEQLADAIRRLSNAPGSLDQLILAASGVVTRVSQLSARLVAWRDTDGPDVATQLAQLQQKSPGIDVQALLPTSIRDFVARLRGDVFVDSWQLVESMLAMLKDNRNQQAALDRLAGQDKRLVFRELDDLKTGRIELPRAGLVLGDRIKPRVTFYEVDRDGNRGEAVHTTRYETEAQLMGLHRRVGAQLIFTRADAGTAEARQWRPNVAVGGEYHYLIRNPSGFWANLWNTVDFGLGLHAASLDQGDDSLEAGIGVQASILGGLITAGYGYNLSVRDDPEYYYIGIDLFDLLLDRSNVQVGAR